MIVQLADNATNNYNRAPLIAHSIIQMAVQKSRKSRSRSAMRRSHLKVKLPTLTATKSAEQGEAISYHVRHHMNSDGIYRGREIAPPQDSEVAGEEDNK